MRGVNGWIARISLPMCALVLASCFQRPYRLEYLSFEKVEGITIEATATMEIEDLTFVSEVPVEYTLRRGKYVLQLIIDRKSYDPSVSVVLRDADNLYLMPQPRLAMRPGRVTPCGIYNWSGDKPQKLFFDWAICGRYNPALPSELVVVFDVLDSSGVVIRRERLPFELKSAGIFWADDWL